MAQKIVTMIALGTFALVIGLGELRKAQEAKEPYRESLEESGVFQANCVARCRDVFIQSFLKASSNEAKPLSKRSASSQL